VASLLRRLVWVYLWARGEEFLHHHAKLCDLWLDCMVGADF
jgi:hypothetical protein